MDREEILARNPLVSFLEGRGVPMKLTGGKLTSHRCATTEHKPGHQCVSITPETGLWNCHDCKDGGSVIDWLMRAEGINAGEALRRLGGDDAPPMSTKAPPAPAQRNGDGKGKPVKSYDYTDESGKLLFQVVRYEPKDFRQRAPDGNGGWVYKLEGVRRVPYNLPKILKADFIWIVEGEKDADTLNAIPGFVATTNCGGAKKWTEDNSKLFRRKDVALVPDNDPAGEEHLEALKKSLSPFVKSIRVVRVPSEFKDITEFTESFEQKNDALKEFLSIADRAETLYRGESIPIQTMAELEEDYRAHIKRAASHRLELGDWLRPLAAIRPLVPGELFTILAGTGCGKTMFLQNLAMNTNLATLLFETELPGTLSFERFAAMATKTSGGHVESMYRIGQSVDWRKSGRLNHIISCHKSRITPSDMTRIINSAELKTSVRPVLVLVDYIQLVQGDGESRYERTSGVAEQLKVVAKETNTIIVLASQIGRPATDKGGKKKEAPREVCLTDGKDSGSIENSSGLVIGGWRDADDKDRLWLKVLKNTKGSAGLTFACRINDSLLIDQEPAHP